MSLTMAGSFPTHPDYVEKLKLKIRERFKNYIKPDDVLIYFHKYDQGVLSKANIERVKAVTRNEGDQAGALELLNLLVVYDGWFICLQKVLRDPDVKLNHVAVFIEKAQEQLNDEIKQENGKLVVQIEVLESENKKKDEKISELKSQVEKLEAALHSKDVQTRQQNRQRVSGFVQTDEGMDVHDSADSGLRTRQQENEYENLKVEHAKMAEYIKKQTSDIKRLQGLLEERTVEIERLKTENKEKDQLRLEILRELEEKTAEVRTLKEKQGENLSKSQEERCHQMAADHPQYFVSRKSPDSRRHHMAQQHKYMVDIHLTDLERVANSGMTVCSSDCFIDEIQSVIKGKVSFRDNSSENYLYASLHFSSHPSSITVPTTRSWRNIKVKTSVVDGSQVQPLKEQDKKWEEVVRGYKEKWGYGVGGIGCDKLIKKGFGNKRAGNEKGEMVVRLEIEFL